MGTVNKRFSLYEYFAASKFTDEQLDDICRVVQLWLMNQEGSCRELNECEAAEVLNALRHYWIKPVKI